MPIDKLPFSSNPAPGARRRDILKKVFVKNMVPGQSVDDIFVVRERQLSCKKNGEPYFVGSLTDCTGKIKAVAWENVNDINRVLSAGDHARIKGQVAEYGGTLQLIIQHAQRCDPSDIDAKDFIPTTSRDVDRMFEQMLQITRSVTNPYLNRLLKSFFEDQEFVRRFKTAPAAKRMHHAYLGGLLEHTLSVSLLIQMITAHYTGMDKDLLLTGGILHDIGKTHELTYEACIDYSIEGRLLNHIVLGVEMVQEKIAQDNEFPRNLALLLKHLIVSHHGTREFGSPEPPKTLEAIALSHIDDLDAKVTGIRTFVQTDTPDAQWTSYHRLMNRFFYKGSAGAELPPEQSQQSCDNGTAPSV